MEPPFDLPVETVLKVDEKEILVRDNKTVQQNNSLQTSLFLMDTQCNNFKIESPKSNSCNLLLVSDTQGHNLTTEDKSVDDKNSEEMSFAISEWPLNTNDSLISNPIPIPSNLAQPLSCNFQELPIDDSFFLQFDYKTRNKLKTKQRRLDPYYRSQEKIRQRTVMRIKRQDPRFRAVEREKGRDRMRIKRLDPEFRSQERLRQRERMKIKRSDPDFRDKEREQQKTRLQEKRLDPAFKEKERAQDHLRMCIKQQSDGLDLYSTRHSNTSNFSYNSSSMVFVTKNKPGKDNTNLSNNSIQMRNTQAAFPENIDAEPLLPKCSQKESAVETFRLKKQRILNFNFYNSSKEQWSAHGEDLLLIGQLQSLSETTRKSLLHNLFKVFSKLYQDMKSRIAARGIWVVLKPPWSCRAHTPRI
ncbi:hypothetical protein JTE90_011095 [Oedothorax gibbosus]|uniref:Uncharacterized protein n=1 Tax=Oedothorax gibbosus TaxID=931172 RepID=A0AAV6TUV9_9ARAC|nr:hypothetical protein JTE90_011095 [Oedothorax gibbosus]